jgi:hypothetical protein
MTRLRGNDTRLENLTLNDAPLRLTGDLAQPARRLEDVPDVPRRQRPAKMITLHLIAIVVAQESDLFIRLDALRDDFQIQLVAQR